MNVERAIRTVVDTGRIVMGERETLKSVKNNKIKLVIVAGNCPAPLKRTLVNLSTHFMLPVYEFNGTSLDLGSLCGRPFHVSMLGVIDAGSSDVLQLVKK